jgi:glyoxylase-like metal-dependent hydrolase (beta-lactamase superfamily II)
VSEPKAVATVVEEIASGVWHWRIRDDRIGNAPSAAHAVAAEEGTVLIDPLPLAPEAFAQLATVSAICLTTTSHQRSAWRLRQELSVPVWIPSLAQAIDEQPDMRYGEGDSLPGGLEAIFTPGAGTRQHSFQLDRDGGVVFTPDLFIHDEGAELRFVSAQYMHDPEEARRSAERLLERDFAVLCTAHGVPVTIDPHRAIRAALARKI